MTGAAIGMIAIPPPLAAQDAQAPGEQIDILAPQEDYLGPLEDCSAEQEAASISGEIVVCRRRRDNGAFAVDEDGAQQRYAEETMNRGDPRTPDVFGIPNHGVVVARGCFIGPCPPPKALMSANTPGAMSVRALLGYIFRNQRADSTTQRLRM